MRLIYRTTNCHVYYSYTVDMIFIIYAIQVIFHVSCFSVSIYNIFSQGYICRLCM